jgi:hypothetical protein
MTPEQQQRALTALGKVAQAAAENYVPEHAARVDKVMTFLQGHVVSEGYEERGVITTSVGAPEGLALEFALLRRTQTGALVSIEDGDVLTDGRGDPQGGDRFGIHLSVAESAYVYVVSADATGWIQPLFPLEAPGYANPLPAGARLFLPARGQWYALDQARGVETFYFIASTEPLSELERLLAPFAGQERPPTKNVEYASVEQPELITRGVVKTRPGETAAPGAGSVATQRFLGAAGEGELVVTRWFRHD